MIKSDSTHKLLCRHISDIHPMDYSSRFASGMPAKEGFPKLMNDMAGEFISEKELGNEEEQLQVVDEAGDVMKKVERQERQKILHDTVDQQLEEEKFMVEQGQGARKKQPMHLDKPANTQGKVRLRRSKRLMGKNPSPVSTGSESE